jgi:L-threonylcarbamoyladenylate synthase
MKTAHLLAKDLPEVAAMLKAGECVAVPTETVYGLAANALDAQACQRIFQIKGRPLLDPLIVHCANIEAAMRYGQLGELVVGLANAFWPGPLTLVVAKNPIIPDIVTAGLPSVALRVPAQPLLRKLLSQLDFPLAAPSANPFGYISPTSADHVLRTLGGRIAAVLDGGTCEHGVESTIIDVRDPMRPQLLRPGPIDRDELETVLGKSLLMRSTQASGQTAAQVAPGSLESHYSPRATLRLHAKGEFSADAESGFAASVTAKIFWQRPSTVDSAHTYWLTESGDSTEAAHNLFALLNRLDAQGYAVIDCERCPDGMAMAEAINDRLRRAAAKGWSCTR